MKRILLAIITLSFFSGCKKDVDKTGGQQITPPQSEYTCYLSTTEDYDHIVTNRYTYNDDHFLTKHETYQGGHLRETWLYYKNDPENWIREDHFVKDVAGDYYQLYNKYYFNQQGKVDSMVTYQCVDCEKLNPTQFERAWYYTFDYDDSLRLLKAQYYSPPHTPNGYDDFEYDQYGRMVKETSHAQDGTVSYYYGYEYTNIDSAKILRGEPSAIDKGLYGYSHVYRETFLTYYTSTTGKTQVTQWLNERNPDGYLNSSANADLASLIAYYKYACFKN